MKVVLATLNAKYIHSSLALRYLRSYVKPEFPDTQICEYTIKDVPSHIVADLYQRKPNVIGFSVYIWNVEETIPIIRMLKKVLPDTHIVLGGPEVSYDARYWMKRIPEADCIVLGEGEVTFLEVLQVLAEGRIPNVRGVVYRDHDEIVTTPARDKASLDAVPTPYGDDEDLSALRDRIVYYETSRGCPFSCQFCLSSIESGVRYFPIERVKDDLVRLMNEGVRTIKFVDRTFNLKRDYAVELFDFLISHRRETVFQFEITGDILHPETVKFLTQHVPSGLFRFEIGVQSTNDLTNSLVKRRQNFSRLRENILRLKEHGNIVQHLDLIAGLPEEDYNSFQKTFDDVFALEPDELQLGFLKMLRGTGMRLRANDYGYVFMDNAPYEIFKNNVLSYDDVLRIKQVEDVLEKYWNEEKLKNTVRYLTRHVYESAFDFFQQFGSFWEEQGWARIGHQLEDLFHRLDEFLKRSSIDPSVYLKAKSFMIYDYLLQYRIRPHKVWWDRELHRRDRAEITQQIAANPTIFGPAYVQLGLSLDSLEKHTVVEKIPSLISLGGAVPTNARTTRTGTDNLHPEAATEDGVSDTGPGLLLVYYPPGLQKGERPLAFVAPTAR